MIVNVMLTMSARVVQQLSPVRINLTTLREYDPPFCVTVRTMKGMYAFLVLYMGVPMSMFFGRIWTLTVLYLLYWFSTVLWWYYVAKCAFDNAYNVSLGTSVGLFVAMSFFFYSHEEAVFAWTPPLWWSMYTLYISLYFKQLQAKLNFISS